MKDKSLLVTMPDGSVWAVPVSVIAADRAKHYADEYGGDLQRSLKEDTMPLFEDDDYEIEDWATGNMNWEDVVVHAKLVTQAPPVDMQEGWINGYKQVS